MLYHAVLFDADYPMLFNAYHSMLFNAYHPVLYNVYHPMLFKANHPMLFNANHPMLFNANDPVLFNAYQSIPPRWLLPAKNVDRMLLPPLTNRESKLFRNSVHPRTNPQALSFGYGDYTIRYPQ